MQSSTASDQKSHTSIGDKLRNIDAEDKNQRNSDFSKSSLFKAKNKQIKKEEKGKKSKNEVKESRVKRAAKATQNSEDRYNTQTESSLIDSTGQIVSTPPVEDQESIQNISKENPFATVEAPQLERKKSYKPKP